MSISRPHVSIHSTPDHSKRDAKKRARDDIDGEIELDRRPFTIKQSPSDPFARPLTLTPLHLLPRAHLPLACLDTSVSGGNRAFAAHIDILENVHRSGFDVSVLVVQEAGGRFYAVERTSWRKYAICRLNEKVKFENLVAQNVIDWGAGKRRRQELTEDVIGRVKGEKSEWWKRAAVEVPAANLHEGMGLDVKPMLDMRRTQDTSTPRETSRTRDREMALDETLDEMKPAEALTTAVPDAPQGVLQELAKQYLEALYISRTSLAYFTKGPLSRTRAGAASSQAKSPSGTVVSISDLTDFLRQSILTSTTMDKKYRDNLAGMVKEIPVGGLADNSPRPAKRKKKRKWKAKRDKNGFYVDEQEFVETWWRDDDIEYAPAAEDADSVMRKRIAKIRNRETFLQIILCLEVLALESSMTSDEKPRQDNNVAKVESQGATETQQEETQITNAGEIKSSKPTKKQDLQALLDTLLDKLTIWYSLESHSPAKSRTGANGVENLPASETDELHSFCIDVVLPFYVSRIPQHANAVNKKLGGPSAPSPVKRKDSNKNAGASTRKPGEPAIRQPPPERKPRQPLSRTVSVTDKLPSKQRHSMPNLQRSSTDSDTLLTHIKREASESTPSIDSIPPARASTAGGPAKSKHGKRPSLMSSLSRREVDFSALSAASEAKLKKKAEVEEKLREAISTLKKPNRTAAVKEVAESADASFAKALSKGKGGQAQKTKAVGNGTGDGTKDDKSWLVAATPSRQRRGAKGWKRTPYHGPPSEALPSSGSSALVPSTSARFQSEQHLHNHAEEAVPASTPAIPATGHRPRFHQLAAHRGRNAVEETPSRGFARFMPVGLAREPGTLDSPIALRKAVLEQSPTKSRSGVAATPLKPLSQPLVEASPNLPRSFEGNEGGGKDKSIYETLGWDGDDEYEELA